MKHVLIIAAVVLVTSGYVNCAKVKYQPGQTEGHTTFTSSCEKGSLCLSDSQKDCFSPDEYKEIEPGTVCRKDEK